MVVSPALQPTRCDASVMVILMNLKELVEYMAKNLVEDQSQVQVKVNDERNFVMVELRVGKQDMGRVIGKSGRIVNAMRTLVRVAAIRQGKRASLEIV